MCGIVLYEHVYERLVLLSGPAAVVCCVNFLTHLRLLASRILRTSKVPACQALPTQRHARPA
jgi:hypothetical protein